MFSFVSFSRANRRIGLGLALLFFSLTPAPTANAAEQIRLRINGREFVAYRTIDLKKAVEEAREKKQPLAWIAAATNALQNDGKINGRNSRSATIHAFAALGGRAVLVFMDAYAENHQGPGIVDKALHTPDPHYTPPTVVLLDPDVRKVLGVITYDPDFEKRKESFKRAILELDKPQ